MPPENSNVSQSQDASPSPAEASLIHLGERLAQERKRLGWTQSVLAQHLGANMRTVRRMEAGAPGTALIYLARALQVFGHLDGLLSALGKDQDIERTLHVDAATPMSNTQLQSKPAAGRMHKSPHPRPPPLPLPLPPPPPPLPLPLPPQKRTTLKLRFGDDNVPVGRLDFLTSEEQQSCEFQYAHSWLERPAAIAISPEVPLQSAPHILNPSFATAPFGLSALLDTAPGPWARRVIQICHELVKWDEPKLAPLDELQYLNVIHNDDRLGALQVSGTSLSWWKPRPPNNNNIFKLVKAILAAWALANKTATPEQATLVMKHACFLGGSRPKLTFILKNGQQALVKLTLPRDAYNVPCAEVLALGLARQAGIQAPSTQILTISGTAVAIINRIDRTPQGGRLHYISAATLMQAQGHDAHGYLELLQAMQNFCGNFQKEARALWQRLLFQVLITHVDDHLRSFGFLFSDGAGWTLAPVFDLNPSPKPNYRSRTPLSAELGPITSVAMLMEHAHHFQLDQAQALAVLKGVAQAVQTWRQFSSTYVHRVNEKTLYPAFEHERLEEALRLIG